MGRWRALGPDIGVLVEPLTIHSNGSPLIALNPDMKLGMGSVFKVFVLAAFARLVERGEVSWEQTFRLTPEVRIPHGAILESLTNRRFVATRDDRTG